MDFVEYVAAGGVVIHDDQMLLLDRPKRGEVRLPKGHVDPGETHIETALRETIEETGYFELAIVADLGERLVEFDYEDQHYRRTEHFYLMRKLGDGQEPRSPKDAKQFQPIWVPLSEAVEMLTYLAEQEVAQRAIAIYQEPSAAQPKG
ncbi:MAG: NUDIX domain-containing protein [Caldilineaceae bacterium]|nr:NUDIX domain-containing protein [Caldilineaceae bacterium]